MLSGKYNPLWHDVDFTNYDTAQDDIFNDISPLAYKSEVDLVKPYVDNLKASFIGVSNGWIHSGVSTDRTDYERIYQVYRILLNTVSILKYYKDKVLVKKMLSINLITL